MIKYLKTGVPSIYIQNSLPDLMLAITWMFQINQFCIHQICKYYQNVQVHVYSSIWVNDSIWNSLYLFNVLPIRLNTYYLLCYVTEITLWHVCSPVILLHIFITPFTKNTSERLLLNFRKLETDPGISRNFSKKTLSSLF